MSVLQARPGNLVRTTEAPFADLQVYAAPHPLEIMLTPAYYATVASNLRAGDYLRVRVTDIGTGLLIEVPGMENNEISHTDQAAVAR